MTTDPGVIDEVRAQEIIDCIRLSFEEADLHPPGKNSLSERQKAPDIRVIELLSQVLNGSSLDSEDERSSFSAPSTISQDTLRDATATDVNPTEVGKVFDDILSKTPAKQSGTADQPSHATGSGNQSHQGGSGGLPTRREPSLMFRGVQLDAIKAIVEALPDEISHILLLGGPGTGKSATAGEAVALLPAGSVLITATTGKVLLIV